MTRKTLLRIIGVTSQVCLHPKSTKLNYLVDLNDNDTLVVADGPPFLSRWLSSLADLPDNTEVPEKPDHKDDNDEDGKGNDPTVKARRKKEPIRERSRFGSHEMGPGTSLAHINWQCSEVPWFTKPQDVAATGCFYSTIT